MGIRRQTLMQWFKDNPTLHDQSMQYIRKHGEEQFLRDFNIPLVDHNNKEIRKLPTIIAVMKS